MAAEGVKPFVMESIGPEIISEVDEIRVEYLLGKQQITVTNLESVLLGANDEVVFIRSFLLLFITTILCPSTYNFVNPKCMYSLRDTDIKEVVSFYFATLCLNHPWNEMNAWKAKVFRDLSDFNRLLWIGGCLPLYAVVYMDFLDFSVNVGQIDYRLPRMSHIRNEYFIFVSRLLRKRTASVIHETHGNFPSFDLLEEDNANISDQIYSSPASKLKAIDPILHMALQ